MTRSWTAIVLSAAVLAGACGIKAPPRPPTRAADAPAGQAAPPSSPETTKGAAP